MTTCYYTYVSKSRFFEECYDRFFEALVKKRSSFRYQQSRRKVYDYNTSLVLTLESIYSDKDLVLFVDNDFIYPGIVDLSKWIERDCDDFDLSATEYFERISIGCNNLGEM